ncbi:hypothetical protein Aperf_G00000052688 [Anoplocephala perfoliata]
MSIVQKSSIQSGPLFLKAIIAWASGDLATTQILCLQCLEGLRYSPSFPHLAACLYFLAFCAKDNNRTEYADDVIDCLQNKCNTKVLQCNLSWRLLESFSGTSKSFFELVNKSYNDNNSDESSNASFAWNDLSGDGDGEVFVNGEYLIAPPAWYHHSCNRLTPENYESLALFCLDMGLRELGVAFAVRAHQESKRRESPDLVSSDCENFSSPGHLTNGHAFPDSDIHSSPPGQLPSLSLPLLRSLHLPVTLQPDEKDMISEDPDVVFSVRTSSPSQNHHLFKSQPQQESPPSTQISTDSMPFESVSVVRRRARGSILKSPSNFFYNSIDDSDRFSHLPNGRSEDPGVNRLLGACESPGSPRSEKKRVRFSLSASHPPPHLEAQFGGRSNSQRLQDMARRRNCQYHLRRVLTDRDYADDDDSLGAFDRLVGFFWPNGGSGHGRRFRWSFWGEQRDDAEDINFHRVGRLISDVIAFVACLIALVAFSLLFLALVVCIPLTWFTVDGNAGVTAGTCVRLLNAFGLQALLNR